jgi:cell division septation protein DedD
MAKQKAMFLLKLSYPVAMMILVISGFSLVVSFYMGMITGQSMRQLPEASIASQETNRPEAPDLKKEDLRFFGLSEPQEDQINLDLPRLDRLQQRTEALSSAANTLKNSPRPTDLLQPPELPAVATPDLKLELESANEENIESVDQARPSEPSSSYTVQVFSSKLRKNAEDVLNQLREKGFPDAYIHTHINQDNSVLYRVRVGKVPKDKAEDRAFELRRLNFIDSVQITRI